MRTHDPILLLVLALTAVFLFRMDCYGDESDGPPPLFTPPPAKAEAAPCGRIVSLAPSVTESLFALGLGDQVAGVTRYCRYPPEARKKAAVGGYLDLNYEAVVALKPDLVVLLPEHDKAGDDLAALGLPLFAVDHRSLDDILNSFKALGKRCGREDRAHELVRDFEARMERAKRRAKGRPKPSVLVVVGREIGSGSLGKVYAAGTGSFYHPLIEAAGGTNACREGTTRFPALSAEGILRLNPDVIVELIPEFDKRGVPREAVLLDWKNSLSHVAAVKNGRVLIFTEDYTVIPGPRLVLMVERLAEVLHPAHED